ncbi:hypothetical protein LXL04_005019 [Taraxacum kok-saghyz]
MASLKENRKNVYKRKLTRGDQSMLSPVCKSYRTKFKLDIRLYTQDFGLFDCDVDLVQLNNYEPSLIYVLGSFKNSYWPENPKILPFFDTIIYLPNRYSFQKPDFGTLQNKTITLIYKSRGIATVLQYPWETTSLCFPILIPSQNPNLHPMFSSSACCFLQYPFSLCLPDTIDCMVIIASSFAGFLWRHVLQRNSTAPMTTTAMRHFNQHDDRDYRLSIHNLKRPNTVCRCKLRERNQETHKPLEYTKFWFGFFASKPLRLVGMDGIKPAVCEFGEFTAGEGHGMGDSSGKLCQRQSLAAGPRRLPLPNFTYHSTIKVCQRQTPQKVKTSYVSPTWHSLPLQTLPTIPTSLRTEI